MEELPDKAQELPIETIVRVKDRSYRPYILLNDIDDKPYFRPYGGESMEDLRKFHKWELEAQKKFRDEKRTDDEVDYLRNVLMSVWTFTNFFDMGEEFMQETVGNVITKIAIIWYCKDKNMKVSEFDPEKHAEDSGSYLSLASFYVSSFFSTMMSVAARSVENQATTH